MSNPTPETSSEPYHKLITNYLDEQQKEPCISSKPLDLNPDLENEQLDYSADDSISNSFNSPPDKPSDGLFHYKKGTTFSSRAKRTTIPTSSIGWLDSFDDKENSEQEDLTMQSQNNHHLKFVNGLPTVVTRAGPTRFYCLKCNYRGTTRVKERMGKGAWILSSLFFLTFFWPCLAVVCCSKKCKDYIHECPRCGHVVGKKRFML